MECREIFAASRPTINWTCIVRSATLGHEDDNLPSLKQGSWTYRREIADVDGGGWLNAKDHFEAEWLSSEKPIPCVYVEDNDSDFAKSAAVLVWTSKIAELRDDHHGQRDPTFLR